MYLLSCTKPEWFYAISAASLLILAIALVIFVTGFVFWQLREQRQ